MYSPTGAVLFQNNEMKPIQFISSSIALACLAVMPLTLEEITEREEGLRQEIAEREHLLTAYQLIRSDRAKLVGTASARALASTAPVHCLEDRAEPSTSPAFIAPKINPELYALRSDYGGNGNAVWWAIQQMTEDYSLRDIAGLLEREGSAMRSAEISVVLTRMKKRGQIEEIKWGRGRRGSVYRKPAGATAPEAETIDLSGGTESATAPAAT